MIGALWNGMSGIISYEKGINVEANNVSNANTLGFKKDTITFEDVLYTQRYGKGVSTSNISKQFEQGNLQPTKSSTDVAMYGKGFFVVQDSTGQKFYTRAGNFIQAEDGLLKNHDGLNVLGINPQEKRVISSDSSEQMFTNEYLKNINSISISSNSTVYNINARTTNYVDSAKSDDILNSGNNYKTSSSKVNDVEATLSDYNQKLKLFQTNPNAVSSNSTSQISNVDYSRVVNDLQDENDFISISIDNYVIRENFDKDIATTLNNLSDRISNMQGFSSSVDTATGVFTIESLIPGKEFKIYDAMINDNISKSEVNTTTVEVAKQGTGLGMVESSRDALKKALENADAKFMEITNVLSYGGNSMPTSTIDTLLSSLSLVEDAKGTISINDDGFMFVSIEGNDFLVSRIGTVGFINEGGLRAEGGNLYSATRESGLPTNADGSNNVVSKYLENANVNYTDTLTLLMAYQKAYEANSKSITTSDDFLQTAMNMIK